MNNLKAFNRKITNSDNTRITNLVVGETYNLSYNCTIRNNESESQAIMVSMNYYDGNDLLITESKIIDVPVGESNISNNITFIHKNDNCELKVILLDSNFKPICNPSILPCGDETSLFIYNEDDFSDIKYNLGNNYKLVNNICLSDDYEPFEFYGQLNGNNYTITYNIDSSQTNLAMHKFENMGLFNTVTSNSKIYDLRLAGSLICNSSYNDNIGSLAGKISGATNVSIFNILSTVNISINECRYVGGIIGYMYQQATGEFNNLIYEGEISRLIPGGAYIGGIVGISSINLYNCISICTLNKITFSDSVGGIVGYMYGNSLYKCASKITLVSSDINNLGSMIAFTRLNITLRYCYNTQNIDMIYSLYGGCSLFVEQCFTSGEFVKNSNSISNIHSYNNITNYDSFNFIGFDFGTIWENNNELTYHPILIDESSDFYNYQFKL